MIVNNKFSEKNENMEDRLIRIEKMMKTMSDKITNSPSNPPRSNRASSTSKIPH